MIMMMTYRKFLQVELAFFSILFRSTIELEIMFSPYADLRYFVLLLSYSDFPDFNKYYPDCSRNIPDFNYFWFLARLYLTAPKAASGT